MKKILCALLVVSLMICFPCAIAENKDAVLGKWVNYATIENPTSENPEIQTQDRMFKLYGSVDNGFIIDENGSVDFLRGGEYIDTGKWKMTDTAKQLEGVQEGEVITFMLEDSTGAQMECWLVDNFVFSDPYSSKGIDGLDVYCRMEDLKIDTNKAANMAWVLTTAYTKNEEGFLTKYHAEDACNVGLDCRFTLRKGEKTGKDKLEADILMNYLPMEGTVYFYQGLFDVMKSGRSLFELTIQYDDSLFGTYNKPNGETVYVKFESIDPFEFDDDPVSIKELEGEWKLTCIRGPFGDTNPKWLHLEQTLEVKKDGAVLKEITEEKGSSEFSFDVRVEGAAPMSENDEGSILILAAENGKEQAFWVQKDGSLCWKYPGSGGNFNIFEKQ